MPPAAPRHHLFNITKTKGKRFEFPEAQCRILTKFRQTELACVDAGDYLRPVFERLVASAINAVAIGAELISMNKIYAFILIVVLVPPTLAAVTFDFDGDRKSDLVVYQLFP